MHPPYTVNVNVSLDWNNIHISAKGDGRLARIDARSDLERAAKRIRAICQSARAPRTIAATSIADTMKLPAAISNRGVLIDARANADRDARRRRRHLDARRGAKALRERAMGIVAARAATGRHGPPHSNSQGACKSGPRECNWSAVRNCATY